MEVQSINLQTIQSQISELSEFLTNLDNNSTVSSSESENLIQECAQSLENNVKQIVSEHSNVGSFNDEDLDAFMNRLKDELRDTETESASLSKDIERLRKLKMEGTCQLESNLESLRHVGEYAEMKGLGRAVPGEANNLVKSTKGQAEANAPYDDYFELMKLQYQIEMNKTTLKSLQDLDLNLKRIEAVENIEEALTGLKVMDFEGNIIKVSLRTYIPDVEGVMCQFTTEDNIMQSEVNHELLIEVMDGTMEVKNVEIFPNDVYVREIVEATNAFSKLFKVSSVPQTRSSLAWFLQKVQDRIVICTIRQHMVKIANKSRHSFEYLDKDELIVAHMTGGIDAFIKPSHGWPLSISPLKLVSFRSSDQNAQEISWSLLSKVEEIVNSLGMEVQKSITKFVDAIEEILLEKLRS